MKIYKRILAAALSLTMILSITACEEDDVGSDNSSDSSELENKKLIWLAWYNEFDKDPAYEIFQERYGGEIEFVSTGNYEARYDKLSNMIKNDQSPDLFPFEINNWPYGAKMFESIDDLFDFNDSKWDSTRDYIEQFKWKDRIYTPITDLDTNFVLWYRKSVIEKAGIDDPKDLYDKGEWDWQAFFDLGRAFKKTGDNKYYIDGFHVDQGMIASTGAPLIGLENGNLVSNLDNPLIAEAVNNLSTLNSEELRYPLQQNDWNVNYVSWVKGNTLFFFDGMWRYEEHWLKYKVDDAAFVPFPVYDKNADNFYTAMKHNAYMLPKGAKNTEGYKAWIDCVMTATNDSEIKEANHEKMKTRGWTDELINFYEELKSAKNIVSVFDFKNGIGADLSDTTKGEAPVERLTKRVYVENDMSYAQLKGEHQAQIENRIKELNEQPVD